jgi:hypothetical protein
VKKAITIDDLNRYTDQGYSLTEALALCGIRRVGETPEQWLARTSSIIAAHALQGLGKAIEDQRASRAAINQGE